MVHIDARKLPGGRRYGGERQAAARAVSSSSAPSKKEGLGCSVDAGRSVLGAMLPHRWRVGLRLSNTCTNTSKKTISSEDNLLCLPSHLMMMYLLCRRPIAGDMVWPVFGHCVRLTSGPSVCPFSGPPVPSGRWVGSTAPLFQWQAGLRAIQASSCMRSNVPSFWSSATFGHHRPAVAQRQREAPSRRRSPARARARSKRPPSAAPLGPLRGLPKKTIDSQIGQNSFLRLHFQLGYLRLE